MNCLACRQPRNSRLNPRTHIWTHFNGRFWTFPTFLIISISNSAGTFRPPSLGWNCNKRGFFYPGNSSRGKGRRLRSPYSPILLVEIKRRTLINQQQSKKRCCFYKESHFLESVRYNIASLSFTIKFKEKYLTFIVKLIEECLIKWEILFFSSSEINPIWRSYKNC